MKGNKHRRSKTLAALTVMTFTLGTVSSTILLMANSVNAAPVEDDDDEFVIDNGGGDLTLDQQQTVSVKEALFANLAGSNLQIQNMDLYAKNILGSTKSVKLNFNGALDYLNFITSNKDNIASNDQPAKFNGNVNIKVTDSDPDAEYSTNLDESLAIQTQGTGKLYLDWYNQKYTISGKVISDVLDFMPTIAALTGAGDSLDIVDTVASSLKDIDIVSILPLIINVLGTFTDSADIDQTPVNGIYTFHFNVGTEYTSAIGLDFPISVALKCDAEGKLTGLVLDEIDISGMTIGLNATTDMDLESTYVDDVIDSDYTNNLDCTTNVLTTVASLIEDKKFATNYSLSIEESKNGIQDSTVSRTFEGNIKGDFSTSNKPVVEVSLNENETFNSQVNVKYDAGNTYFKVNNLVNGYLEKTTIDSLITDITDTISSENTQEGQQAEEATDALNDILSSSKIYDIYNGNWSAYKDIIKSLTVVDEVMTLTVDAQGIYNSLPSADFTLNLDLSDGKLNSVSIEDLPFREVTKTTGYTYLDTVSFNLSLTSYDSVNIAFGDLDSYTNFKVVTPLYNTIAKVIDTKTVGVDYNVQYFKNTNDKDASIIVTGDLNADLNDLLDINFSSASDIDSIVSTIRGENLGTYDLTAQAEVNGMHHNIKMAYQNKGLYMDYKGVTEATHTRMSLTQGSIFNIYDVVNGLINKGTTEEEEVDPYAQINDTLVSLLDITDGSLWNLISGSQIKDLEDYIDITQSSSGNGVKVDVDTNVFGKDYGSVSLVMDGNTHELLNITADYTNSSIGKFSFELDFKDYEDPTISQDEINQYYKSMDGTVEAIINIINGLSGSATVEGSLTSTGDKPRNLGLNGWMNFESMNSLEGFASSGSFSLTDSSADENTKIEFQAVKDTYDDETKTYTKSGGIDLEYNDKIRAYTEKQSVKEALTEFANITDSSLIYIYIKDYLPLINVLVGGTSPTSSTEVNLNTVLKTLISLTDGCEMSFLSAYQLTVNFDFSKLDTKDLLGLDVSSFGQVSLTIDFLPEDSTKYIAVTINDLSFDDCQGDVTLYLNKEAVTTPSDFGFNSSCGKVWLEQLPILMKIGVNLLEKRAYMFTGTLTASTGGIAAWFLSVDINASVEVYLRVGDTIDEETNMFSVDGYIKIINSLPSTGSDISNSKVTDKKRTTEFFIKDTNAYITRYDTYKTWSRKYWWSSWNTVVTNSYDYFKVTQKAMLADAVYYVLEYALGATDLYNTVQSTIEDSGSSSTDIFSMFKYFDNIDGKDAFQVKLNVYSLLDVYADLYYDSGSYELTKISAYTSMNLGVASVSFNLSVDNIALSGLDDSRYAPSMQKYDNFLSSWNNNSVTKNLEFRPSKDNTESQYFYTTSSPLF
ncbi:MAG: hypothetical protein WCR67_00320 [Bacilli bacterium]